MKPTLIKNKNFFIVFNDILGHEFQIKCKLITYNRNKPSSS